MFVLLECDADSGDNVELIAVSDTKEPLIKKADEVAEPEVNIYFELIADNQFYKDWESPANTTGTRVFSIQTIEHL